MYHAGYLLVFGIQCLFETSQVEGIDLLKVVLRMVRANGS